MQPTLTWQNDGTYLLIYPQKTPFRYKISHQQHPEGSRIGGMIPLSSSTGPATLLLFKNHGIKHVAEVIKHACVLKTAASACMARCILPRIWAVLSVPSEWRSLSRRSSVSFAGILWQWWLAGTGLRYFTCAERWRALSGGLSAFGSGHSFQASNGATVLY